jgi:hypothetical protein
LRWNADNAHNAVGRRQNASFHIDRLTGVCTLVEWLGILDGQSADTAFGLLKTTWWFTDGSPVQTPIDVGIGNGDSSTCQFEGVALVDHFVGLGWLDDGGLDTANFIGAIVAIVSAVALEALWHTLAAIRATEFGGLAEISRLAGSAIPFV